MKVAVASENPVKISAVRSAFKLFFAEDPEIISIASASGVPDQPLSDEITRLGSMNRAIFAQQKFPNADFCVGLEGGVEDKPYGMEMFAWMTIVDNRGNQGLGKTCTAMVPTGIADLIREGLEMGHAADRYFAKTNTKHKEGLIGILTGGLIDRQKYYEDALIMALIGFRRD